MSNAQSFSTSIGIQTAYDPGFERAHSGAPEGLLNPQIYSMSMDAGEGVSSAWQLTVRACKFSCSEGAPSTSTRTVTNAIGVQLFYWGSNSPSKLEAISTYMDCTGNCHVGGFIYRSGRVKCFPFARISQPSCQTACKHRRSLSGRSPQRPQTLSSRTSGFLNTHGTPTSLHIQAHSGDVCVVSLFIRRYTDPNGS